MRLLIVDHHPVVEEGLLVFLEQYPEIQVVASAGDGVEGLEKLRQTDPDTVLIDLVMPKLEGWRQSAFTCEKSPTWVSWSLPARKTIFISTRPWKPARRAMSSREARSPSRRSLTIDPQ